MRDKPALPQSQAGKMASTSEIWREQDYVLPYPAAAYSLGPAF
jgi:hypothetical protein